MRDAIDMMKEAFNSWYKVCTLVVVLAVIGAFTGCAGPQSVWISAEGSGAVEVGVDENPPLRLEHDGDVELRWSIDEWPPQLITKNADQCASISWLWLELDTPGCNPELFDGDYEESEGDEE